MNSIIKEKLKLIVDCKGMLAEYPTHGNKSIVKEDTVKKYAHAQTVDGATTDIFF